MKKAIISVAKIYIATILLGVFQKILFLLTYSSQSVEIGLDGILGVFWNGLKLDISVAGYITALPLLLIILGTWGGWKIPNHIWRYIIWGYLAIITLAMGIIASVDINLYGYWGYRIDATLLPYLSTPSEAAASVTFSDVVLSLSILLSILFVARQLYHWAVRDFGIFKISWRYRISNTLGLLLLGGFLFLGIRGGVGESVANVSKVYFSPIQYANHAAVNPSFSLLSSLGEAKRYDQMYPFYENDELTKHFAKIRGEKATPHNDAETTQPNVLIIIGESYTRAIMDLEAEGKVIMPNLRQIASDGLLFDNAYATGGRTDRGVASILSSFPTQPKLSIMKIPAKSRKLPSIARSLQREGYSTHFYYGGDLNFMDMSSYLYSTGWEYLTWERDVPTPAEGRRQWGYSDGVMANIVADSLAALNKRGTPYLASWLTLSSHEPFDVPKQYGFEDKMFNSMAYTDEQIGNLFTRLKESGAWDTLLIVIVADHAYHYPYGVAYNSPQRHHIPLIWSGGALERFGIESSFVSQMDIAPTLLAEMGVDNSEFIFGREIFDTTNDDLEIGYYTFNDGAAIVDSTGMTLYDNTSQRSATSAPRSPKVHDVDPTELTPHQLYQTEVAKTTLQMTHTEIERY